MLIIFSFTNLDMIAILFAHIVLTRTPISPDLQYRSPNSWSKADEVKIEIV